MSRTAPFHKKVALPEWPIRLIRQVLPADGVWLVGGTVRDLLSNRPLHDWDFVVSTSGIRSAKQVADAFKGAFYVLDPERKTGRAIVQSPDSTQLVTLDFAMLRDSTLTQDLQKRDFTVNAMAMTLTGELLDPLGFLCDMEDRIIRMTSSACFRQDPLRLLRAVRQSFTLDYTIEHATYTAICQQAHLINTVSPERILTELCTILDYPFAASGIQMLENTRILLHIFPETELDMQSSNGAAIPVPHAWDATLSALRTADFLQSFINKRVYRNISPVINTQVWDTLAQEIEDFRSALADYFNVSVNAGIHRSTLLKWALFLRNLSTDKVRLRMHGLRMPNKSLNMIEIVIQTYPLFQEISENINRQEIFRFYRQAGDAGPAVIFYALALNLSGSENMQNFTPIVHKARILLRTYFEQADEYITPVPLVTGNDLLELGIEPGPNFGIILEHLLEDQVMGLIKNRSTGFEFALKYSKLEQTPGIQREVKT